MNLPFKSDTFPSYVLANTRATRRKTITVQPTKTKTNGQIKSEETPESLPTSSDSQVCNTITAPSLNQAVTSTSLRPGTGPGRGTIGRVRPQRPCLSDQLKNIGSEASAITNQLRVAYQLEDQEKKKLSGLELFQMTTNKMVVGRLESKLPCPVTFYQDHCRYLFQHPFERKEIQMVMYYKDMQQVQLSVQEKSLRFRIDHALEHFGQDYQAKNLQHGIKICFVSEQDTVKIKAFLQTIIKKSNI
jgi:hypothetical protein